jgi:hypothetical protein
MEPADSGFFFTNRDGRWVSSFIVPATANSPLPISSSETDHGAVTPNFSDKSRPAFDDSNHGFVFYTYEGRWVCSLIAQMMAPALLKICNGGCDHVDETSDRQHAD